MLQPNGREAAILAAVADASDDAIVVAGRDGAVIFWSPGAARLYGYAAEDVEGRPLELLVLDGRRPELAAAFGNVLGGGRVELETSGRTKDGRVLELRLTLSPVHDRGGRTIGAAAVARDVTSPQRDRRARRATELRWQSVIESAVDGIVVIDDAGRIEAFNPAAERLFGYDEADVLGRNVSILMPPPYRDEHDGYLARYLREGHPRIIGIGREVQGRRRDGTVFPLHLSVGEMSADGQRKFTGILHDLSERVRLEERLRASEARWRAVIESAVDGIVVIDAKGIVEAMNPAAERLFGYAEPEIVGRNVSMLMPPPYRDEHDGYLARYLREGTPRIIGIGREVTGLRRDGSTFPVHLSVGEMSVNGERKFTGILHDLSARVALEGQLREQAAMAKLGEMAAVVAHEVRNPLAGIRGAIQIIGSRVAHGGEEAAVIREMIERIDSLGDLIRELLLFARPPVPELAPVEIPPLLTSIADLLAADPALAGVRVAVEGSAPVVHADPSLLRIVFLNLLINGAHALDGRGTVSVSVGASGAVCVVAVADHGPGIPPEIRDKVFTPFFTTKARGTGLGLPTARRLVEAHGGRIRVDCPPQGGTTVTVELPLGAPATR